MGAKLLFIDDEDIVLRSSKRIFAGTDYEIETAPSGDRGLAMAMDKDSKVRGSFSIETLPSVSAVVPRIMATLMGKDL